jgi:hypothetical protein
MKRQISRTEFEDALRGSFAADMPEPATLGLVLSGLGEAQPARRRAVFRTPAFAVLALVAVLCAAFAAVAIPLTLQSTSMVETPTPVATPRATDPLPTHFTATGSMSVGRGPGTTATLLRDGRVLVAGGCSSATDTQACVHTATAEIYDPTSGTFTRTGSMTVERAGHTATLLRDGRVLITGGHHVSADPLASAELYDPSTGRFTPTGSMSTPREGSTAVLLKNGKVFVFGGAADGTALADFGELYDPSTGQFKRSTPTAVRHDSGTVTLLVDGRVLIAGGTGPVMDGGAVDEVFDAGATSAELYDPLTDTFSPAGAMVMPRSEARAALLPDGRVFIVGGLTSDKLTLTNPEVPASVNEIYDPATARFVASGPTPDVDGTVTPLADGRVLLTGTLGYMGLIESVKAELLDPRTRELTPAGAMVTPRWGCATVVLKDGRVLLVGGLRDQPDPHDVAEVEIYHP